MPHTHDSAVRGTTQLQGHGAPGAGAVRGDTGEGVALGKESVGNGTQADRSADVTVRGHHNTTAGVGHPVQGAGLSRMADV